jgi:hypothetical protein
VVLKVKEIKINSANFYKDTGADTSIIKEGKLKPSIHINKENILAIVGITPGECRTLDQAMIELEGLKLNIYVVPDSIPIDTDGLIGWDILNKYGGSINAAEEYIKLNDAIIPFRGMEHFKISARTRKIIYAYTSDNNIDAGWVPLQDMGLKILFGNFIAINHDGKIYGECINISYESVTISAPIVQLIQCETIIKQNTVDRGEIKKEASIKEETISIRRVFQENITDYENTGIGEGDGPIEIIQMNKRLENDKELLAERVKNIMSLVDLE